MNFTDRIKASKEELYNSVKRALIDSITNIGGYDIQNIEEPERMDEGIVSYPGGFQKTGNKWFYLSYQVKFSYRGYFLHLRLSHSAETITIYGKKYKKFITDSKSFETVQKKLDKIINAIEKSTLS